MSELHKSIETNIETEHGLYVLSDVGLWTTLSFPERKYDYNNPIPDEELSYQCGFIMSNHDGTFTLYSHLLLPQDFYINMKKYESDSFTIQCKSKIELLMEMATHNIRVDAKALNMLLYGI